MRGINKVGGNKELRSALFQGAFAIIYKLPDEPKTLKQAWLKERPKNTVKPFKALT